MFLVMNACSKRHSRLVARRSVAVVPLIDLGHDAAVECVAETFTGLVAAKLAGVRSLDVTRRVSSRVGYVVEGSVLALGPQLRIAVTLLHGTATAPLLTRSYTGQFGTILRLRGEIAATLAREIARALKRVSGSSGLPPYALDAIERA